jgi:hypothetical protein
MEGDAMVESRKVRADRFVLIACGAFALLMTVLTLGAAAKVVSAGIVAMFILLGLAPYGFTALLSVIQPMRRLVVATARAVTVVYGLFDCGLRYLALYHPGSSTDAVVVAVLPFWWVPTVLVVAALTTATLWAVSRRTGRPAFA